MRILSNDPACNQPNTGIPPASGTNSGNVRQSADQSLTGRHGNVTNQPLCASRCYQLKAGEWRAISYSCSYFNEPVINSRLKYGQLSIAAVKQSGPMTLTQNSRYLYCWGNRTHLGLRAQTTLRHSLGVKLNGIIGKAEPVMTPEHQKTTGSTPRAPSGHTINTTFSHILTWEAGNARTCGRTAPWQSFSDVSIAHTHMIRGVLMNRLLV